MHTKTHNIFFVGLMGAGKTTLGRQLAKQLERPFYDSDQIICERTGVSIPTIFEMEGEEGFRLREENRRCLRGRGTVVYLHAKPEVLLERTRYDKNRPLLQVADPLAKLEALYAARDPLYRQTAHLVVEAGGGNCQKTAAAILHMLQD